VWPVRVCPTPPYPLGVRCFAIRLAALVNLGPSDASDAVWTGLDGWARETYVGGESPTAPECSKPFPHLGNPRSNPNPYAFSFGGT